MTVSKSKTKSIRLASGRRYVYDSKLYLAGTEYKVNEDVAEHLLDQENIRGLPMFMLAGEDAPKRTTSGGRGSARANVNLKRAGVEV